MYNINICFFAKFLLENNYFYKKNEKTGRPESPTARIGAARALFYGPFFIRTFLARIDEARLVRPVLTPLIGTHKICVPINKLRRRH
jgi:hypothetical protein